MTQSHRLAGGLVDRSQPLGFSFDGAALTGYAGDTLASALLANGVKVIARSFKYHRPRGIVSAGSEEPNALLTLRGGARREPNIKATTVELFNGLHIKSQNRWPSLAFDVGTLNELASPLLVAGFYYKTFMWPAAFWEKLYEPLIRRAAGLGSLSGEADPDAYDKVYDFCDLLVIGAGPAGLMAALTAGRAGLRVILAESDFLLGGRLNAERYTVDGSEGATWALRIVEELRSIANITLLQRTSIFGAYDSSTYGAIEQLADHLPQPPAHTPRQRLHKIVAKQAIVATGATERPLLFEGNDKPGIMLAGAVRTYINRYAVMPGRRATVFTCGDDGWRTAADLARAGIDVAAIIDTRSDVAPDVQTQAGGADIYLGARVECAHGRTLNGLTITDSSHRQHRLAVDLLAVHGGWNGNNEIATHLGAKATWSDEASGLVVAHPPPGVSIAGAAGGRSTLAHALTDGARLGREAARQLGRGATADALPRAGDEANAVTSFWHVGGSKKKAFVDLQNDVTAKDIEVAACEGFVAVEHLKRYTTLGMATDQGRTSNLPGAALLAQLTNRSLTETGVTRARPPVVPVAIGAFAGSHRDRHFKPTRLTAGHALARQHDATFVESGQWLRAQWFTQGAETTWLESATREAKAVRSAVGICDVSTLGKIALFGPDVGIFLDRVYINTMSTLAVGRTRYGAMLREDGFVMDDGTVARLGEESYVLSTTTANAVRVMQHLEYCHQVLWPSLRLRMVSVTEQWAQYSIAGPRSRELLRIAFGGVIDLSNEAFAYMACGEFRLRKFPVRLFRVSFSGELAYEAAVPADYGEALAEALMRAGADLGVTLYGTEALGILRVEKGHPAGNELNGMTTAHDIGLGKMMSTKKDYIGRVMAQRPALLEETRPTLVGLVPVDRGARLRAGSHLLARDAATTPENDEGYITSAVYSPHVASWIALGLLSRGPQRIGERIRVYDALRGGDTEAQVVSPIFVDPAGERLRV